MSISTENNSEIEKTTLINKFQRVITMNNGHSIALRWESNLNENLLLKDWDKLTWSQYYEQCMNFSKCLLNLGFKSKETICIYSYNCTEWLISFMGGIMAGGQSCGIYPSDSIDQIKFKINDSNCSVLVVENNQKINDKLISDCLNDSNCSLRKIIIINSKEKNILNEDIIYWDDFMNSSSTINVELDTKLNSIQQEIKPDDTCVFVYTSGTTGNPKAVCISHDNLIFEAETVLNLIPNCKDFNQEERIISYLPLSHVAGMMVDIICPLLGASKSYTINLNFSRSSDLKEGTIKDRLILVKPTLFLGVPRVWEKFYDGVMKKISLASSKQQSLINWAKSILQGKSSSIYRIPIISRIFVCISNLIINKIKTGLGLNECKYYFSGAAPLSIDIIKFFQSLNINIAEVYGMSECTGSTSFYSNDQIKIGCCGKTLVGTEIKVVNSDNPNCIVDDINNPPENLQGEVCFRGRHVMSGYYCKETSGDLYDSILLKNRETIDSEGWLHSGDKGAIDSDGNLKITGRYKEIIIGAGGENIAPVPIENKLKQICPIINQVIMIGDQQKYNIALITLKLSNYGDDIISGEEALVLTDLVENKLLKEACKDQCIIDEITKKIEEVNKDGSVILNNAFKIQKFCILPSNFSIEGGEFTATLKIKRSFITDKYKNTISNVYDYEGKCYSI